MDKKLLLEKYVRVAIKKAIQEQEARQKKAEKAMYLIYRFPGLKKSIEELMSPSFGRFITAVDLVAPKPTTFKVTLINGYDYNITYLKKDTYQAKIAGKKYYLLNLGESERAAQAIADLLDLSPSIKEGEEATPAAAPAETGGGISTPQVSPEETAKGAELAADLSAAEETPAPEEIPAPEETPAV
jgi:hypothetical protein